MLEDTNRVYRWLSLSYSLEVFLDNDGCRWCQNSCQLFTVQHLVPSKGNGVLNDDQLAAMMVPMAMLIVKKVLQAV